MRGEEKAADHEQVEHQICPAADTYHVRKLRRDTWEQHEQHSATDQSEIDQTVGHGGPQPDGIGEETEDGGDEQDLAGQHGHRSLLSNRSSRILTLLNVLWPRRRE